MPATAPQGSNRPQGQSIQDSSLPLFPQEQRYFEPDTLTSTWNTAASNLPVAKEISSQERVRIINQIDLEEVDERLIDLKYPGQTRLINRSPGDRDRSVATKRPIQSIANGTARKENSGNPSWINTEANRPSSAPTSRSKPPQRESSYLLREISVAWCTEQWCRRSRYYKIVVTTRTRLPRASDDELTNTKIHRGLRHGLTSHSAGRTKRQD